METALTKFKVYDFKSVIKGPALVTSKLDGIQCVLTENGWRSKRGEDSLLSMSTETVPGAKVGDVFEYFNKSWENSCAIRRKDFQPNPEHFYMLSPCIDSRLIILELTDDNTHLDVEDISVMRDLMVGAGLEGLVIHTPTEKIKVKAFESFDVEVIGVYEGIAASRKGKLGGVVTAYGKVSSGWTDEEREKYFKNPELIIGQTIEVKSLGLTNDNKFRHPSKLRIRWDK